MRHFKFKDSQPNIEKLYRYALYKFPRLRNRLEYDEWANFVFFKKDNNIHYFYYVKNTGDLYFSIYKNCLLKKDIKIITDFKQRIYDDNKLMKIFDKILKPLDKNTK